MVSCHITHVHLKCFPGVSKMYTVEQIATPQVAVIVDLLIRRNGRYR